MRQNDDRKHLLYGGVRQNRQIFPGATLRLYLVGTSPTSAIIRISAPDNSAD